jgi:ParB family chromosome partitioning protein
VKKQALGKGLSALFPELLQERSESYLRMVPIAEIRPPAKRLRKRFDDEKIRQMADSMVHRGVVQPVVLRKVNGGYEIIVGERRWRAAQKAGINEIPAIIREASTEEVFEIALIENLHREDLNPIEQAEAYHHLMESQSLTHEQIASKVGKDRSTITNTLRLLKLPDKIKQMLISGEIHEGHARALICLEDEDSILKVVRQVVQKGLSARQTEALVRRINKSTKKHKRINIKQPDSVLYLEERLRKVLGTKVEIQYKSGRGKINIHFFSDDQLNYIVKKLM